MCLQIITMLYDTGHEGQIRLCARAALLVFLKIQGSCEYHS